MPVSPMLGLSEYHPRVGLTGERLGDGIHRVTILVDAVIACENTINNAVEGIYCLQEKTLEILVHIFLNLATYELCSRVR